MDNELAWKVCKEPPEIRHASQHSIALTHRPNKPLTWVLIGCHYDVVISVSSLRIWPEQPLTSTQSVETRNKDIFYLWLSQTLQQSAPLFYSWEWSQRIACCWLQIYTLRCVCRGESHDYCTIQKEKNMSNIYCVTTNAVCSKIAQWAGGIIRLCSVN